MNVNNIYSYVWRAIVQLNVVGFPFGEVGDAVKKLVPDLFEKYFGTFIPIFDEASENADT
jgi:hypothetical protein